MAEKKRKKKLYDQTTDKFLGLHKHGWYLIIAEIVYSALLTFLLIYLS